MPLIFDREAVESQYSNILIGFSPFIVKNQTLLLKHLTPLEIFESNTILLGLRDKYKENGLLSEYEILKDLAIKGIWTKSDDLALDSLEKRIQGKRRTLGSLILPSQQKQVEAEIRMMGEELKKKKAEKMVNLTNSYEFRLQQDKVDYLTYLCTYKNVNKKFWKNLKAFEDEDRDFIVEVMESSSKALNDISSRLIRYIARTTDARSRLKTISIGQQSSIFLLELRQWCDFYDSLSGMVEPPSEDIISDDDRLDGWLMSRRKPSSKSVNTNEGFVSHPGATKNDMEIMGGVGREDVIKLAEKDLKG